MKLSSEADFLGPKSLPRRRQLSSCHLGQNSASPSKLTRKSALIIFSHVLSPTKVMVFPISPHFAVNYTVMMTNEVASLFVFLQQEWDCLLIFSYTSVCAASFYIEYDILEWWLPPHVHEIKEMLTSFPTKMKTKSSPKGLRI